MTTIISSSEAKALLNSSNGFNETLTKHLRLIKSSNNEFVVLNQQGRQICHIDYSVKMDSGEYIFRCDCVQGRAELLCHHSLVLLKYLVQ